jgi:hypothetical protein
VFKISKDNDKQAATLVATELIAFLDTKEAKSTFTDKEINDNKEKFRNYLK